MKIKAAWILSVLSLSACTTEERIDYFPLSVGSRWEYSFDVVIPGIGAQEGKAMVRVEGQETIEGKSYYKMVTSYSGFRGMTDEVALYRKDATGIYEKTLATEENPETLYLPIPLKVGETWTVQGTNRKTDYQIEGAETVEVPSRKFENCLKISYDYYQGTDHSTGHYYLAPGVGVVKRAIKMKNGTMQMILEKYEH